ncbi:MAG TPA: Spy/CpxP family protein refolding chaperone [Pseudolabrys sp.]|nr:Spy/CpxP family protein refolding chaperone [Pseudolabrys sp.]
MRARTILIAGLLAATTLAVSGDGAQAQLRGLLGIVTSPLRGILGHRHGHHRPMSHRREAEHYQGRGNVAAAGAVSAGAVGASAAIGNAAALGSVGPSSWPTAYGDIIGYALWPSDYQARYRQHGFGDLVAALAGSPGSAPVASEAANRTAATTTGSGADNSSASDAKPTCTDRAAISTDWPAGPIKETENLNATQQSALDDFQSAVTQAGKQLEATCNDPDVSPIKRLDAMKQRLWAIQSATALIRGPLQEFYATLSNAQKASFNRKPAPPRAERRAAGAAPMGQQYQVCAQQAAGDPERLMQQIQEAVRPGPEQRARFEAFGKTAGDMAKLLIASCAQPIGADPLARLDAADNQLTAMNNAASTLEIALNELYGSLSDEQKARFDSMGR